MGKKSPWSYRAGRKGVNRVEVSRARPGEPIRIQWYAPGRHRKVLQTESGLVVTSREIARRAADLAAARLLDEMNAVAVYELFGLPAPHTVSELLEELHAAREADWRPSYVRSQAPKRRFWESRLGGVSIAKVTPSRVKSILDAAARAERWSPRTQQAYGRYLVDAFYFAQHDLKWIEERNNLSAVRLPRPDIDNEHLAYTKAEVVGLLEVAEAIDLRFAFLLWVAIITGRRLGAILPMRTDWFHEAEVEGQLVGVVRFPREVEKSKKARSAVLSARALEVARRLMAMPAVATSGVFFPGGSLDELSGRRSTVRPEYVLKTWLPAAETAAGVPHVDGRGIHGMKRAFATLVDDLGKAGQQANTSAAMLEARYRQDYLPPKAETAAYLERVLLEV